MATITKRSIHEFQKKIDSWFQRHGRIFPWRRRSATTYQIIMAEVLLQRTKAETVARFYGGFLSIFPSWRVLASSRPSKIQNALRPLGLYRQRTRRLKELANEMVRRNNRIPTKREELESIPLFGQYLVNAVELLILRKNSPLIDVNMSRVLERYFGKRKMADIRYDPYLQSLSRRVIDHVNSKEINWAILDYAALVCKHRNPNCKTCILAVKCTYFKGKRN